MLRDVYSAELIFIIKVQIYEQDGVKKSHLLVDSKQSEWFNIDFIQFSH